MIQRKSIFGYIVIAAAVLSTILVSLTGYALSGDSSGDTLVLTLNECIDKAVSNSNQIPGMDITVRSLERLKDQLEKGKKDIENGLVAYQALYLKKAAYDARKFILENDLDGLTDADKLELEAMALSAAEAEMLAQMGTMYGMYGIVPPVFSFSESQKFKVLVKGFDFPYYELEAQIHNLGVTKETLKNTVKQGMRQLYDGILSLNEGLTLQEELYRVQEKQNAEMLEKFKEGQVSELDVYTSQTGLEQTRLGIDKTRRTIENMEMTLKRQTGIDITRRIELKPYEGRIKEPLSYDEYLDKALEERSEIVTVKKELEVKNKEFDITKQYITDTSSLDWQEAQIGVNEKNLSLVVAVRNVTVDIRTKYNDVLEKKAAIEAARQKEINARNQYAQLMDRYEQGDASITQLVLLNANVGLIQAETAYKKALRDYDSALYSLELASNEGIMDLSGMGGN